MSTPPAGRIEAWFTGPDAGALNTLTATLTEHGARATSEPWTPFGPGDDTPPLQWSMVLEVPAAIDPTFVAATAEAAGCRYHPGGGAERWEQSPVTRRTRIEVDGRNTSRWRWWTTRR